MAAAAAAYGSEFAAVASLQAMQLVPGGPSGCGCCCLGRHHHCQHVAILHLRFGSRLEILVLPNEASVGGRSIQLG